MAMLSSGISKDNIKPLCDYNEKDQNALLTSAVKNKIGLYVIGDKNGEIYALHSGEIENIRCKGDALIVIRENQPPMPRELQKCFTRHIWVDTKSEEALLEELSVSTNSNNVFDKYSTPNLDVLKHAVRLHRASRWLDEYDSLKGCWFVTQLTAPQRRYSLR